MRTPTLPPATHTNVYALGDRRGGLAIVDPASPYPDEQAALDTWLEELAAGGERVCAILLTHHHGDHMGGAAHLGRRLGVPVLAHVETARLLAGRVPVDRTIADGEELVWGEARLAALHTPGHAPGHLIFVDERSRAVVAGDMVASVGTIIIDPSEGDMRQYLASLARMLTLGASWLLPSHGEPVGDPRALLEHYVAHRLERERRVLAALVEGAATAPALVPRAYPEVSPFLYPLAARSLLAHLIKLRDDGRAVEEEDVWRAVL